MADPDAGGRDDSDVFSVSDAVSRPGSGRTLVDRLHAAELWVLVDANRWAIVGLLTAAVFVASVLVGAFGPVSVRQYVVAGTVLSKAYVELQTINVTVVTIVLAINQLVLSPELGSLGTQRERLESALEERRRAERAADLPASPTDPSEFLQTIARATGDRARRLREAVGPDADPEFRRAVEAFVGDVTAAADRVRAGLEDERFDTIDMLGAAMHFTTATSIRRVRSLRNANAEALSAEQDDAFEDLLDVLKLFTIVREYFRSLYVQWEFIGFSRAILYTGLPAVVVAHFAVGFVDANAFPGTTLGIRNLLLFESATFALAVLPVTVVISYVARLNALARTAIFISPFSPDPEDENWNG